MRPEPGVKVGEMVVKHSFMISAWRFEGPDETNSNTKECIPAGQLYAK
jgi:hypothetical protein